MDRKKTGTIAIFVVVALVAVAVAYAVLTAPDHRTPGEKINDAIGDASQGLNQAAHDLGDRTTGQNLGDKIKGWTAPSK